MDTVIIACLGKFDTPVTIVIFSLTCDQTFKFEYYIYVNNVFNVNAFNKLKINQYTAQLKKKSDYLQFKYFQLVHINIKKKKKSLTNNI